MWIVLIKTVYALIIVCAAVYIDEIRFEYRHRKQKQNQTINNFEWLLHPSNAIPFLIIFAFIFLFNYVQEDKQKSLNETTDKNRAATITTAVNEHIDLRFTDILSSVTNSNLKTNGDIHNGIENISKLIKSEQKAKDASNGK